MLLFQYKANNDILTNSVRHVINDVSSDFIQPVDIILWDTDSMMFFNNIIGSYFSM